MVKSVSSRRHSHLPVGLLSFLRGRYHHLELNTLRAKAIYVSSLYAVAVAANVIGTGHLGWVY